MDIQVSSNFERLLFELLGRDPEATAATMRDFRATGHMPVPEAAWRHAGQVFRAVRLDDEETLAVMRTLREQCRYPADPHSAIAIEAARQVERDDPDGAPIVAVATAHEGKFREAVHQATGQTPPLPEALADLYDRVEHVTRAPAELATLQSRVRAFALRNAA